MYKCVLLSVMLSVSFNLLFGQPDRWQQRVKYSMDVAVDATTNRLNGKQKLEYTNNSPDTLTRVFYHLYWNAFQPNSMMDVRSREMGNIRTNGRQEWDSRVRDRISKLTDDEIGYQKILSLTMNGISQKYTVHETILEVQLSKPILPKSKVTFDMVFEAQVPLQVRRAGRDAANGVRYSMSQWYPKLAEYDQQGWHPNPYIAREFYGVWGDYEVKITIDKNYILGGTGYLQNASQIGYGYETEGSKVTRPPGSTLTWHFIAPNVHDFMWAADPEYRHITRKISNGPVIHVLYNRDLKTLQSQFDQFRESIKSRYDNSFDNYLKSIDDQWNDIADAAVTVYPFITKNYGSYPYKQYSFIHGGDGGMEYPMGTLLAGPSLGTAFHEWMHTWYQMILANNESLTSWIDEGFSDWATDKVQAYYRDNVTRKRLANDPAQLKRVDSIARILPLEHADSYNSYFSLAKSNIEEPLTTHADHFNTNTAYSIGSYSKGAVFVSQLGYIVGDSMLSQIMKNYYQKWAFRHPDANDFIRVAEKTSQMQLQWYKEYWVNSIKTIDYSIDSVWEEGGKSQIRLRRIGKMPMPIDLSIEYNDGSKSIAYVPMYLMFGAKQSEDKTVRTIHESWKWTHPTYIVQIDKKLSDIKMIEIDPTQRMADIDRKNNRLELNR